MQIAPIDQLFEQLAAALAQRLARRGVGEPHLIGVQSGGVWVATRVREMLGVAPPLGTLDISFHRDDFGRAGLSPNVRPSQMPWDVADKHIVLVDDVLYTGRTVRAALNEIFDWGRPASVTLAVLVSRDGRELPIQADARGAEVALAKGQHLKLRGPDPLRLDLIETDA